MSIAIWDVRDGSIKGDSCNRCGCNSIRKDYSLELSPWRCVQCGDIYDIDKGESNGDKTQ